MKRLYFLAGAPARAEALIEALKAEGVRSENIHIVAAERHLADRFDAMPATMDEHTDVQSSRKRGVLAGAATGLLAGLAITLIPGGIVLGGGAIAMSGLIGASLGMTIAGIIGGSEENPIFAEYESRIEAGEVLIAVDSDVTDAERIADVVHGVDPSIKVEERTMTDVARVD